MTEREAARVLQVDRAACRQVVDAAFGALREMTLASGDEGAPRRLADLNRAHRLLAERDRADRPSKEAPAG